MQKKDKVIIFIMLILLGLLILSESSEKRINWYPSFSVKHKIPFGSYVAHQEAKKIFGKQFETARSTPYIYLQKHPNASGTYVLYNDQLNMGKPSVNALLKWVEKGNNVLISANFIDPDLMDSLHLKTSIFINEEFDKKLLFKLLNPNLKSGDTAVYDQSAKGLFLTSTDSIFPSHIKLLGKYCTPKSDTLYNFVSVPYGKGKLMIHTLPYAFTNYFILKDGNLSYFEGLLSYINSKKPVIWDTYFQNGTNVRSVFKYIIQNDAFLWSYRLLFIGLFVYILFEGKRKQRVIPVIDPPQNDSLIFTQTVADMYIGNKEDRQIAIKHIQHFMDYVRHKLHLDTRKWDAKLQEKIAQKSKSNLEDVQALFHLIEEINSQAKITPKTVVKLDTLIQKIKRNKA